MDIPIIIACSVYNVFLFQLQYFVFHLNGRSEIIPFIVTALASIAWLHGIGFLIYWGYKFGWLEVVILYVVVFFVGTLFSLCLWVVCWRVLGLTKRGTNIILGYASFIALPIAGYFMWILL